LQRRIYLRKMDLNEAMDQYFTELEIEGFFKDQVETVPVKAACKRILSKPVFARRSVPEYNSSAVDGISVRTADTIGAKQNSPKVLSKDQFSFVNTGNSLNPQHDAVIMIENVHIVSESQVEIRETVHPLANVRTVGEDVCVGEMIFPRYKQLEPFDLSLLLAAGIMQVEVIKQLSCAIIPTGSEIVDPEQKLHQGEIPETNSTMIRTFLEQMNVKSVVYGVVPDDLASIEKVVKGAMEKHDVILLNGGSSAGDVDYTYQVVEKLGRIIVHGINIKPGKPTVLGIVRGKPVIGLPGYPGSCYIILSKLLAPLIERKYRYVPKKSHVLRAVSARRLFSSISEEEYVHVGVGKVYDRYVFFPFKRGASILSSLSKADGTVVIPKGIEVVEEGETVYVDCYKSREEMDNNIIVSGSHDISLSFLADSVKKTDYMVNLVISNVGSMGGIRAISKKCAHIAGIHLFDPSNDEYNIPFIKKYKIDAILIHLCKRQQGLLVQKGNPKSIHSISDLTRKDIRFVNRQKSSGTRILLDYLLRMEGIDPSAIRGYENEEYTHTLVALKIKKDLADVGLGISSVAKVFDLDFIPIKWERYDLLVLSRFYSDPRFELIMKVLKSKEFRQEIENLTGYDFSEAGQILYEGRYSQ